MNRTFFLLCALGVMLSVNAQETFTRTLKLMGTKFDITVVAENETMGSELYRYGCQ